MELGLSIPPNESVLGVWHFSKDHGHIFIIRCHICDIWLMGGYEKEMVDQVGMDAAEEWVEQKTKFEWNKGAPCKHINFDLSIGVSLQSVWMEWAGRGPTTGSSQEPLI